MPKKGNDTGEDHRDWLMSMSFIYLQQNQYNKALTLLQVCFKLFPNDEGIVRALAYTYLKTGHHQHVVTLCDRIVDKVEMTKERAPFFLLKSQALWALNKQDESRQALKKYYKYLGDITE